MQNGTVGRGWTRLFGAALMMGALAVPACKDDNPTNPGGAVIVLVGSVNGANGAFSGSVSFNINGTVVTGSFRIVAPTAATHALTGTYNTSTRAVSASGGGYTFAGTYDGTNQLSGTVSGTGSGTFVAARDAGDTFCGTFAGDDDGVWNFTIDGSAIVGTATTSSGTVVSLSGTISGNAISLTGSGGVTATGTRSGTTASGTWSDAPASGTWTGSKCN